MKAFCKIFIGKLSSIQLGGRGSSGHFCVFGVGAERDKEAGGWMVRERDSGEMRLDSTLCGRRRACE